PESVRRRPRDDRGGEAGRAAVGPPPGAFHRRVPPTRSIRPVRPPRPTAAGGTYRSFRLSKGRLGGMVAPVRVRVDGKVLELSNLDKVLYPATGFTKAEVID